MECISRTMAAALKPSPRGSSAPGSVVTVKKVAVSLTRRADVEYPSVPVIAMGSAVYLFMKVARNAPRIIHGDVTAMGRRFSAAPFRTMSMSSQSGLVSISVIRATSSGGASGTASSPSSQAVVNISTSRLKPYSPIRAA